MSSGVKLLAIWFAASAFATSACNGDTDLSSTQDVDAGVSDPGPGDTSTAACPMYDALAVPMQFMSPDNYAAIREILPDVPIYLWTINDPGEMAWLLHVGVDGIMTDRPDILSLALDAMAP